MTALIITILFSVESDVGSCLFVWGSAGTGKTLLLTEALKIKASRLVSQGRRVRILVTTFQYYHDELQNTFLKKYLVNMTVEVMGLDELCRNLGIKFNKETPPATVNRVISALAARSHARKEVTLILLDEVLMCWRTRPDWRKLEVRDNVVWLLGLSPRAYDATSTEILPPVSRSVITRHLVHKHRNCQQILTFYKYFVSHHTDSYLSMGRDQEVDPHLLPQGVPPIWIEPPEGATHLAMLRRVESLVEYYKGKSDLVVLVS